MRNLYQFHHRLILRSPARPFASPLTEGGLDAILHDEAFMEALYVASPVLQEECQKWRRGELTDAKRLAKLRSSVVRYYTRMSSRCTPFGLFAGCSLVEWGNESRIMLDSARHTRHTRLDMHYLCALAQALAMRDTIRPRLRYRPNSSWYQIGEEVRYIEQQYVQGQSIHQISSLGASEHVAQVLAACADGETYIVLLALLAPADAEQSEAAAFLDALIEAQVLVSELEPLVTGPEFLPHVQQVLARLYAEQPDSGVQEIMAVLADVVTRLQTLDVQPINVPAQYQGIVAALLPLGVPLAAGKLFQVDAIRGVMPEANALNQALQAELLDALDVLAYLTPATQNPRLVEFIKQFEDRYETCEVPLLEVLDTESGISYSAYGKSSYCPLVHDLELKEASQLARVLQHDEVQQFMYQKLRAAERNSQYTVELDPQELKRFRQPALQLPPSLSILFRPVAGNQLLLDGVGGSSAANLLGRFAHGDSRIERVVRDITEAEQRHNPAVAFAELCHLPTSRVGNILLRPAFRALEIPYLAQSGLPAANQVRVQDLTLRLHRGQLELRSRLTQQRIMPRLSTAHNYSVHALPVYELLSDLQTQGLQAQLGFSWQSVSPDTPFSPRLTCRRVVLAAASWQLDSAEWAPLLTAAPDEVMSCLLAFRQKWRLPRFFTLVDGDNELLVDASNSLLVKTWLAAIRGRSSIRLRESLLDPTASPVCDAAGHTYAAQFIALLVRQEPCYAATQAAGTTPPMAAERPIPRDFLLGSEWLYYKLYCGPMMANRILREIIGPLVEALRAAGLIDVWFFVRYADPATHLRVRFHLSQTARIGEAVQLVNQYLTPGLNKGYLWKSQTDTYRRELERYGPHTIALTEQLFHYQSTALLAYLVEPAAPTDGDEGYWLWGLRAMDELLRAFGCTPAQQLALLQNLRQAFAQEFGLGKVLKLQLDSKYRQFRPAIQLALTSALPPPAPLLALAASIREGVAANPATVKLKHLLSSYLHMLLNRLVPADARLHELVLYDFLARHYQSVQHLQPAAPAPAMQ